MEAIASAFSLHQQGKLKEAAAAYKAALLKMPDQPDALHLLGLIHKANGDLDTAEKLIRRSLEVRPDFAAAHYNLGNLLADKKDIKGALVAYQAAVVYQPDYPEAYYGIGNCCRELFDEPAAYVAYTKALELKPDYYEARHNRGNALRELARTEESVSELKAVLAQVPDLAEAHYNLAHSLFTLERYQEAGPHYDYRWLSKGFTSPTRDFGKPKWDGRPLPQGTLLVYQEQGLGDTLQFIRYVHLLRQQVKHLIVEVQKPLIRLLKYALPEDVQLVGYGGPLPAFDFHSAMISMPWLAAKEPYDGGPYLKAEPDRIEKWRIRLGDRPGLKIGINWQGNPLGVIDRGRSMPLKHMAPIMALPGVRLIALQKNAGIEQLPDLPGVETLGDDYDNEKDAFLDAAGVMKNLDVFITTDTALAHLAGGLGIKTCLLLKWVPDWRWGLNTRTSVWYKSLTLHRQKSAGDWKSAIEGIVSDLKAWQVGATAKGD